MRIFSNNVKWSVSLIWLQYNTLAAMAIQKYTHFCYITDYIIDYIIYDQVMLHTLCSWEESHINTAFIPRTRSEVFSLTRKSHDPASRCSPWAKLKLTQRYGLRVLTKAKKFAFSSRFTHFVRCAPGRNLTSSICSSLKTARFSTAFGLLSSTEKTRVFSDPLSSSSPPTYCK